MVPSFVWTFRVVRRMAYRLEEPPSESAAFLIGEHAGAFPRTTHTQATICYISPRCPCQSKRMCNSIGVFFLCFYHQCNILFFRSPRRGWIRGMNVIAERSSRNPILAEDRYLDLLNTQPASVLWTWTPYLTQLSTAKMQNF